MPWHNLRWLGGNVQSEIAFIYDEKEFAAIWMPPGLSAIGCGSAPIQSIDNEPGGRFWSMLHSRTRHYHPLSSTLSSVAIGVPKTLKEFSSLHELYA
jgi:hypothetical protein